MKIALISVDFSPSIGGLAAHTVELGKALVILGHEVHVLTLPIANARSPIEIWQGMTVHRPRLPKSKPLYTFFMKLWLGKFLKQHPMDIIHVHGMRPLEATKGLTTPVLFTNHTSGYLRRLEKGSKVYAKLAQRLAHICHVIAPSEELCEATKVVGFSNPVNFIPNGVDTTRFTPAKNHSDKPITILLARRLVDKNGVVVYAKAVSFLKGLNVQLIIAGNGPERKKVEYILKINGMLAKTTFLGDVPNQEMPEIYRTADISVLPSLAEATSITGLESMACGLPLIGTRVGGIPTIISDGETGLLVPAGDAKILGQALLVLINNPTLRQQMGVNARTKAEQQFSWQHIATKTVNIYQRYTSNN